MTDVDTMIRLAAEQGPEAVVSFREKALGRTLSAEEKKSILDNDYKALYAFRQNRSNWHTAINQSTNDLLSSITVPCLLYAGECCPCHEGAKEAAKHIHQGSFMSFPGLDHYQGFMRSNLVLPHVKKFLTSVTRKES